MSSPDNRGMVHSTQSTNLADLLERLLDKGVVISGDIRIKLVDIELLTIQIRLVICSVDRAVEMGMDWWRHEGHFSGPRTGSVSSSNASTAGLGSESNASKSPLVDVQILEQVMDRLEAMERRFESLPRPTASDGQRSSKRSSK